jgi:hypothetical protein
VTVEALHHHLQAIEQSVARWLVGGEVDAHKLFERRGVAICRP